MRKIRTFSEKHRILDIYQDDASSSLIAIRSEKQGLFKQNKKLDEKKYPSTRALSDIIARQFFPNPNSLPSMDEVLIWALVKMKKGRNNIVYEMPWGDSTAHWFFSFPRSSVYVLNKFNILIQARDNIALSAQEMLWLRVSTASSDTSLDALLTTVSINADQKPFQCIKRLHYFSGERNRLNIYSDPDNEQLFLTCVKQGFFSSHPQGPIYTAILKTTPQLTNVFLNFKTTHSSRLSHPSLIVAGAMQRLVSMQQRLESNSRVELRTVEYKLHRLYVVWSKHSSQIYLCSKDGLEIKEAQTDVSFTDKEFNGLSYLSLNKVTIQGLLEASRAKLAKELAEKEARIEKERTKTGLFIYGYFYEFSLLLYRNGVKLREFSFNDKSKRKEIEIINHESFDRYYYRDLISAEIEKLPEGDFSAAEDCYTRLSGSLEKIQRKIDAEDLQKRQEEAWRYAAQKRREDKEFARYYREKEAVKARKKEIKKMGQGIRDLRSGQGYNDPGYGPGYNKHGVFFSSADREREAKKLGRKIEKREGELRDARSAFR